MTEFEGKFQARYGQLNDEQRLAVDMIDGPVLVLAGPGTGKTELLSMRVANILRQTDARAQNILCLTFTDAASANMTDRMAKLFGPEAYKVSVGTFHSFCLNAMNQFGEYFNHGGLKTPASELEKAEVISEILRELPYDNALAGNFGELPIYLKSAQSAISNLKRQAGLTPNKLRQLAEQNLEFIDYIEADLVAAFGKPFGRKKTDMPANIAQVLPSLQKIGRFAHPEYTLAETIAKDLAAALQTAESDGKTTALTAFRNAYVEIKKAKMSDRVKTQKLLALADVYEKYDLALEQRGLFDFDDMILSVGEMLAKNADFKADLQERYQYILIDEFQDTNDAQMNIIYALTDYDQPNVMAVGDDDQAIYSFQGANVNNVSKFLKNYPAAAKIQLFRNYRSQAEILELADDVINASEARIKKNVFDKVENLLVSGESQPADVKFYGGQTAADEHSFVAAAIVKQLKTSDADIAIIAKQHSDLRAILPYLEAEGVGNVVYENRQNALDSPPVRQLELLARVASYISDGRNGLANTVLPELLASPAFDIPAVDLWRTALAVERGEVWLERMLAGGGRLGEVANWLVEMSQQAQSLTLEQALDGLFEKYHRGYYFSDAELAGDPDRYLEYLSDLQAIRQVVREHHSTELPSLAQFVEILDLYRHYDIPVNTWRNFGGGGRVHLLTAHKAKGLEFDTVFILDGSNQRWLSHSGGQNRISMPSNLQITAEQDDGELWRLLFVAITRARRRLVLTHHSHDAKGRTVKPLELEYFDGEIEAIEPRQTTLKNPDPAWNYELVKPNRDLRELLADRLANYKLNATAVNNYVNLEYAGPQAFLLNNLLRFPSAKSANAEFGSAIHQTLKAAHQFFLNRGEKMPLEQARTIFTADLTARHLSNVDHEFYLKKGLDSLKTYLNWADFNADQAVERKITVRVGEMTLTGNLDLIQIDKKSKTIAVFDYKTGSPFAKFDSGNKFKTHGYKQQLMFYKLLLESAPEYAGYQIEQGTLHFVEPVENEIKTLDLRYNEAEIAEFVKLIEVIWNNIQNLTFPDVSNYEKNLKGSLQFEKDLLDDAK